MKYNINNLHFAKCRHCIMDIINVTDEKGHIMSPHPDYVEYYIKPYAFVDGQYGNIDCFIRTPININGGEDEIYCYPNGQTKVVFFPTISSIFSDNTDMGYLYFDAYEQVDLSGGYNYGTFKLTALLFLSLLLF